MLARMCPPARARVCVCVFGDWQGQGCPLSRRRKVKKGKIKDVWSLAQGRPWELKGGGEVRVRAGGTELQAEVTQETPQAGPSLG